MRRGCGGHEWTDLTEASAKKAPSLTDPPPLEHLVLTPPPQREALTQLRGGLHQAPGLTAALSDDQVQHVGLQAVLQHLVQGRAQVLQDEVTHVGAHPAVPQLGLAAVQRSIRD